MRRVVVRKPVKAKAAVMARRRVSRKLGKVIPDQRPIAKKSTPEPTVRLSEDHIVQLLRNQAVLVDFPEFQSAACALKKRPRVPRGCASCAKRAKAGRTSICQKVMHHISTMSKERQTRIKHILSIRGTMRIEYRLTRISGGKPQKGKLRRCAC